MQNKIKPSSKTKRSLHFLIDHVLLLGIPSYLFENKLLSLGITSIIYLVYIFNLFILEPASGKTIGKFITQSITVTASGKKLGFARGILKSIVRFIPLDIVSFFFSDHPIGWHDKLSGTIVVDEKEFRNKLS